MDLQEDRGLVNTFTKQIATAEQAHDLLNFHLIGEEATAQYYILNLSSSGTKTIHRKKLLTMATPTKSIKKVTQKQKESKQIIKCLRRRLAWSVHTSEPFTEQEQYSIYPRALADENGIPTKSSKCTWTNKLKSRYNDHILKVFSTSLDSVVILDAMFLINTKPSKSIGQNMPGFCIITTLRTICSVVFLRYTSYLIKKLQSISIPNNLNNLVEMALISANNMSI